MKCASCGVSIENNRMGRPKLYCSRNCGAKANRTLKPKRVGNCELCGKEFTTAKDDQRYCQKSCRLEVQKGLTLEKTKAFYKELYPDGIKRKPCGWCGDTLEVPAKKTLASRKYHEGCSLEAQRARYRIKTVKRQSKTKPSRLSADQVLREYGSACHICHKEIDLALARTSRMGLTVDHVIPLSKGGSDELDNLRPAHWICNIRKSDKVDA
jgi:5-methylcytosine-specific restriction endonuclease McrA